MDQNEFVQRNGVNSQPEDLDAQGRAAGGEVEEPPITSRDWWVQNGPVLAIVFALLALIFIKFDSDGIWAIVKAALGLSLVVFIHELGHFLVAKWCDVHVTTFSIGFGPAIPGCRFQWGETTYKFALFPLGGYVQMVGQVDGDESSDGSEEDPRSFKNKSVGQRMAIISAGVIMNVILAIVCFVIVFRGPGKDRIAGVVGTIDAGAPGFKNGLQSGMDIKQIGDIKNPYFENLKITVMTALPGEKISFVATRPWDGKEVQLSIEPRNDKTKGDKNYIIGLLPGNSLNLATRHYVPREWDGPFRPGSAAAQAEPAFAFGDKIVATSDPDNPETILDLPDDPRNPGKGQRDYFEFQRRMQLLAGKEVKIVVERGEGEDAKRQTIKVPPSYYQTLGVRMQMGHITNLRDHSPAAAAGVQISRKNDEGNLIGGDVIQGVEVKEPDGTITKFEDKKLDPERLPYQLRDWAKRMEKAKVPQPWHVTMHMKRSKEFRDGPQQYEPVQLKITWDNDWRHEQMIPFGLSSPMAVPELGLAYQIKTFVADVIPGLVTDNPLRPGDAVSEIRVYYKGPDGGEEKVALKEEMEQWARVATVLQMPNIEKVKLKVSRSQDSKQETKEIELVPVIDPSWPVPTNGIAFMTDVRRQWADSNLEAIQLGLSDTWDSMRQIFQNLRGMIIGTISIENLGGPVTIARVAYRIAGMDFWEFVFFLGLISVNLAVINFLPIPVLDGGHMVFLLYEKLRGKPAPEGVRIGATYVGLAMILCLMVFVLYLDISRLF
ncbi:MAG: site-2 protease family protein [Gemmataceae bacterium]|nr:site-2 protease family protein [Gemmataceae bacterium]MCI0738212.1 site-2 protease family protein [Gemmataceae bacterium]